MAIPPVLRSNTNGLNYEFKNLLENMLSLSGLIYLILISGMVITVWLMIRYYRNAASYFLLPA